MWLVLRYNAVLMVSLYLDSSGGERKLSFIPSSIYHGI